MRLWMSKLWAQFEMEMGIQFELHFVLHFLSLKLLPQIEWKKDFSKRSSILWQALQTYKQLSAYQTYNLKQINPTMKEQGDFPQLPHNSFRIKAKSVRSKLPTVGHYQIGQIIGKGGFANVHKAVELHTKTEVAVKVVNLEGLFHKDLQHLRRQIFIHKQLNHPNIVRIYETIWTDSHVYIFMELVKGFELFNYLNKYGPLPETTAAKIFSQMISAVQHLHDLNVAHRDIKTQNIIIDADFNAKLIDFGLAKIFNSPNDDYLETFCGSPSYVAPELLESRRYSGQRVDIWCLGVTLYVMLEACLPFDDCTKKGRENNIQQLNWHRPLYSSQQAIEIYNSIFKKERLRVSMDDLLGSAFFAKHHLGKSMTRSKLLKKLNSVSEDQTTIIERISMMLDVEEAQVKTVIENRQIGEIFSVFQILSVKKIPVQGEGHRKASKSQARSTEMRQKNYGTMEPRSTKTKPKERPKSRHESTVIKILPVVNDPHYNHNRHEKQQKFPQRHHGVLHEPFNIEIPSKDEIVKEAIKAKAGRFRNIFTKDLGIKEIKPRLRDDSPDSPKRILDCVKVYN